MMALRRRANRRRICRTTPHEGLRAPYEAPEAAQSEGQGVEVGASAALEAARRADARPSSHEHARIEAADVHQEALQDVGAPSQMHPAQAPGFVEMRVGSLKKFAALAQQPQPAGPPNPPPVGIHSVARRGVSSPATPAAVGLRHVAAQPQVRQCDERLVAVVPLVADDLGHASTRRQYGFDLLRRGNQRLDHRRRVARIGILRGDADDRARLRVDRGLGLVGQVRPAVLHLRDLCVRVLRMRPIVVRALLRSLPVQTGQFGTGRRRDAGRRRQAAQERLVAFARVPADDAPQRRVRFQRRNVDADRLPLEHAGVGQPLQHPREDRLVRLDVDPAPRPRDGVEWSGGASCSATSRNCRRLSESDTRHAIARSDSRSSK